ncbi:tetratricopeptide repeat protein [Streptomyces sp. NBC_01384]|uniref:tetratricopeptide repeat protein n=1 Tax=Streptomyces sp. NBC_01384 TaxID=2903847 RepID=UPI003252235B
MSRLSREQKREFKWQRSAAAAGGTPIEVRVPAPVGGTGGGATVGGMPVVAAPGETVQAAVLNHLHHLALTTGHPVLATVHDERIGFLVPLQVYVDGSSGYAGEPVRVGPPAEAPAVPATPPAVPVPPPAVSPVPLGEFGPAPVLEAMSVTGPGRELEPKTEPKTELGLELESELELELEPEPKPTPARGFDAVAESVLAPVVGATEGAAFLMEPVARINEAVKQGWIEEAAGMAERAGVEASRSLGPEHAEVLRLRELTAYIAYLAGDPLRSFHLSLDLAQVRRRHRDPDAAYGNVQSAAAAWRAVRDPLQGLNLGHDLITLWAELVADGGPAADDLEQLESARTRMNRLADRARTRAVADNPYTQSLYTQNPYT